jgi:SAM-dependent methyltransferase
MWDDPDLYDLENADDPEFDLGFWSSLVSRRRPRSVLELACGTGRLTVPLASSFGDVRFVGLDTSEPFLSRARSRARAASVSASFVGGDMRAPEVDGDPFDLVFVPFNSLAYLVDSPADRLSALSAARALLAPGGTFALDLLAPRYDLLAEACVVPPVVRMDANHAALELGVARFIRRSSDEYDPSTQTLRSSNSYEIHGLDGTVSHRVTELEWHIWFPSELESMLAAAGLAVTERFGGYAGEPWGPSARRMLWVCAAA